jgi:manganese/zinc/iron transport system permease protein
MDAFWIILTGSITAIACALAGTFLVLRKMSMLSDAISHAVLPGIVSAFLLTGSRTGFPVLIGAGSVGLLSSFLIEYLHKRGRVQSDASIGVTFTWLFALGIILISTMGGNIDIDPDCVLYGEIAYVPLDLFSIGNILIPQALISMGSVLLITLIIIFIAFKELTISTFDPEHAQSIGINTTMWHYILMGCVSFITVAAFDAVGAIIVVALFTAPPSAALLLSSRLSYVLILASLFGVIAAIAGYFLAIWMNGSIAGAMALITGIEVLCAIIISRVKLQFHSLAKQKMIEI